MGQIKRILVTRTDRIGDVVLSTPVLKTLRLNFPESYIAVMVRPYAQDVVLGNPYINEVIVYDKDAAQRSFFSTLLFALSLRRKRFDLALMLHPTNRVHIIAFLAGIKTRIGYDRKMSFLLSDKIKHEKQLGLKHERDYALDMLKRLGVSLVDQSLYMPIRKESEQYVDDFLASQGWQKGQRLIAIHPAASCRSKIWPVEHFARVANALQRQYAAKIVVVSAPEHVAIAQELIHQLERPAIDACGKTSVSQLASLLRRCALFISNDSGPVHIASALAVPVIAIFGRRQPGLSPRRWGPVGEAAVVLHKDSACQACLAHLCRQGFACIKAITPEEALAAAAKILQH